MHREGTGPVRVLGRCRPPHTSGNPAPARGVAARVTWGREGVRTWTSCCSTVSRCSASGSRSRSSRAGARARGRVPRRPADAVDLPVRRAILLFSRLRFRTPGRPGQPADRHPRDLALRLVGMDGAAPTQSSGWSCAPRGRPKRRAMLGAFVVGTVAMALVLQALNASWAPWPDAAIFIGRSSPSVRRARGWSSSGVCGWWSTRSACRCRSPPACTSPPRSTSSSRCWSVHGWWNWNRLGQARGRAPGGHGSIQLSTGVLCTNTIRHMTSSSPQAPRQHLAQQLALFARQLGRDARDRQVLRARSSCRARRRRSSPRPAARVEPGLVRGRAPAGRRTTRSLRCPNRRPRRRTSRASAERNAKPAAGAGQPRAERGRLPGQVHHVGQRQHGQSR